MVNTLLDDIKAYFISKGISASSIYIDGFPSKPEGSIALYEYEGRVPVPQINGAIRPIQIVTRDKSPSVAKELSLKLFNLLRTSDGVINFTPDRWSAINIAQSPFKLRVDDSARTLYGFNITLTTYLD